MICQRPDMFQWIISRAMDMNSTQLASRNEWTKIFSSRINSNAIQKTDIHNFQHLWIILCYELLMHQMLFTFSLPVSEIHECCRSSSTWFAKRTWSVSPVTELIKILKPMPSYTSLSPENRRTTFHWNVPCEWQLEMVGLRLPKWMLG